MNRKCPAILLSLCLTAGMLAGCAGKGETADRITLDFWTIELRENYRDYFEQLISEYEEEHPGVDIKWTDVKYDDMRGKLDSAIETGNAPDVVNLNTQMALTFAGEGKLTDRNEEADQEQKQSYTESLWESTKIGDSVYAFPWYSSPEIMFYNKELLNAGGLEDPPADYDEALTEAVEFHDKTGAFLFSPDEFFYILMEEDIPILNADRTKAVFNTDKAADLLRRYKEAADRKAIPKNLWGDWEDELALYESSKLATLSSSGSALSDIKENAAYIYKRTGISASMTGSSGYSVNSLMNLVVPSESDNVKEATDFAAYVTDDENQLAFCKLVSIFPSTKEASQDSFFTENSDTPEGRASMLSAEAAQSSKDFSLGVADQDSIQETIDLVFDAVVLEGEDPEKALDEAVKDVDEILEQYTNE